MWVGGYEAHVCRFQVAINIWEGSEQWYVKAVLCFGKIRCRIYSESNLNQDKATSRRQYR